MLRLLRFLFLGTWALPTPEKTCCYRFACRGLRSPACWSGFCRAHCFGYSECQCEKKDPAEAARIALARMP